MTLSLDNVSKANSLEASVDAFVSEVARVYTEAGNNPVKIKDVTNELQGRREDIKKAFSNNLKAESPQSDSALQKEVDRLKQENDQLRQTKSTQPTTRTVDSLANSGGRAAFGIPSGRITETIPGQPLAADPYGKNPEDRVRINQETGEVQRETNDQNQFSSLPSDQGAEMIASAHKSVTTADGQQTMTSTPGVNAMRDTNEANEKLQNKE